MEKLLEGYKLVRKELPNLFYSAFSDGYVTKYKLNEFTYPKKGNGPLAVFDTLDSAKNFLKEINTKGFILYKCKYTKSENNYLWFVEKSLREKFCRKDLPIGTICADKVMLIEKV